MLLKEYMVVNNIWTAIGTEHPFTFISDAGATRLNALLGYNHGDKTMFKELATPAELAALIVTEFKEKWLGLENIALSDLSISARSKTVVNDASTNTDVKTNVRDDLNKVSAFNSEVLITNDGVNSTGTENFGGSKTRAASTEIKCYEDAYKNLSLIEKNAIMKSVTKDVANFLTLSLY